MRKCSKPAQFFYLIMNKPCGYVCAATSDSHKTVYELLSPQLQELVQGAPRGQRLHTVGRLDCDTSGLLLLTNDGSFSHRITAEAGISKTYRAGLESPVGPEEQKHYCLRAAEGLTLPAEKKVGEQVCEPAQLNFLSPQLCEITIYEGKFHQVRRIFRALGNEVIELERISIGKLKLPADLERGQWRSLSEEERKAIF